MDWAVRRNSDSPINIRKMKQKTILIYESLTAYKEFGS